MADDPKSSLKKRDENDKSRAGGGDGGGPLGKSGGDVAAGAKSGVGAPSTSAVGGTSATTATGHAGSTATGAGTSDAATATTGDAAGGATKTTTTTGSVPVTAVAMKLLDVKLKPSGAIFKSIIGDFSSPAGVGFQELVVAKAPGVLELYQLQQITTTINSGGGGGGGGGDDDDDGGQPTTTTTTMLKLAQRIETHSIIRDIVSIRVTGQKRDLIAISSDSGALSVMDFAKTAQSMSSSAAGGSKSSSSTSAPSVVVFGKTGCRRSTPGQYLAADPKGRAVMISAIEKRKLVYVINHQGGTSSNDPTTTSFSLASPLEAHRSRSIHFCTVGVDNGYDNPLFACIEVQYPEFDEGTSSAGGAGGGGPSSASGMSSSATSRSASSSSTTMRPQKQLAYYELDLGLNHVSRKWATSDIPSTACCMAALPGGADGPSGVLIGSENMVTYHHYNPSLVAGGGGGGGDAAAAMLTSSSTQQHHQRLVCFIPRRKWEHPSKGILITQLTVHRQKKNKFFALAQSEVGDVYKIAFVLNENNDGLSQMSISILDTLPVANSLNISKKGMLFVAAEFANHGLYKFERIDSPDAATHYSDEENVKNLLVSSSNNGNVRNKMSPLSSFTTSQVVPYCKTFTPTTLQNLYKVYTLENPTPTTGVLVGELAGNEVSPQIYTLAGKGPTSCIRILRHGASVTELAVSELPGVPGGIFTIPEQVENDGDSSAPANTGINHDSIPLSKYIVVSFADATLVLSVGDTVEEVGRESGFLTNAPTLSCSALRGGSICQIHPAGVRQIHLGKAKQWHCPGLKRIECASSNTSQVLIALAGGEVIYFELDTLSGNLTESATKNMGADVCCLDVGMTPPTKSRSMFAAVGCRDQTIKIVTLEPGKGLLTQKSSLALKARPHSVVLLQKNVRTETEDIIMMIGLEDGSSLRATVDPVTGTIGSSPTRRFLGARPVSVSRIPLEGRNNSAMLLLSSRPWISRQADGGAAADNNNAVNNNAVTTAASGKHIMAPLSYAPLDHGCAFSSEAVREGIVATAGKTLRIISVDTGGMQGGDEESFNTNQIPLRYTPRQMTLLSTSVAASSAGGGNSNPTDPSKQQRKVVLAVVESDYNDYGQEEKKSMGFDPSGGVAGKKQSKKGDGGGDGDAMDMDEDSDEEDEAKQDNEEDDDDDEEERAARSTPIRGPLPPEGGGHWGSCVRLLDPSDSCRTLGCIEMNRNEAALCCTSVRFHTRGGESLLAVGTVTGMTMHPLKQTASHVVLYRVVNGDRLQLLHRTTIDDGPVLSLAHFQGRLLVGIGKNLRLYEMGKRQLLRKCELRGLPTFVKTIQTAGDRAYFGDMMRSLHIVQYDVSSNRLILIASDPSPRPIVSQELLDWNTVAVGDKFGNISILRLPRGADTMAMTRNSTSSSVDRTGQRALWDSSRDDTTPKLEVLCQYYVGEVVTSMTRSSLVAGGAESLIYVTVTGRIGALVPFTSRDDVEFFTQLEGYLRTDAVRPTGRDPHAFRSYYVPSMHVIDGDLCDSYINKNTLVSNSESQIKIAERLDRTVGEILKKLEDTRNSLL